MSIREWDHVVFKVLTGNINSDEIPQIPQRVIRVYLSSTGKDSQTERNAFVEQVYPKLREYCSKRYGVDFQIIDLEWGVPAAEKPTINFRLKELQKCHTLSAGPSFVAFIGQKYGEASLPTEIPAHEFEAIRVALKGHKGRDTRAAPLLDRWFTRDDNSIPPVYLLNNVSDKLPNVNSTDEELRTQARTKWSEVEVDIRRMLQRGSELCYLEGLLDGDTKEKYVMSDQDLTIQMGTEESGSPKSRCVLLVRKIVDLKNYVEDEKARDFIEITFNEKTERQEIDQTCSSKLNQLRTRANGLISNRNSLDYEVLWRYDDVIHPKLHAPYLEKLCTELHDSLVRLIDETVPNTKFDVEPDIYEEVLQHWVCCKRKASDFYGQEQYLERARAYLKGQTDKPFVIYGESGAGKTTLLSKLASEVRQLIPGKVICTVRYVGYTPKSSDIKQIIMTLCSQLLLSLQLPDSDIPYDFKDLQRYFHELLNAVPADVSVVILLDSLDKLNPEYNAHFMSWVPTSLRSNTKIIFSTHPEKHKILERLKTEVVKDEGSMLEMKPLSPQEAEEFLQYTLGRYGRQLSSEQVSVVRNAFQGCSYPMYVQLLADMTRTLTSFDGLKSECIPVDIKAAINQWFDVLEKKHGKMLVGRSLGYLVASVTGLSDCEMEDLLSLDDDVLNSVFVDYHPPVRRIPFVKWLSVKNDIEQFLTYREADGITVYFWCHEEFDTVIRERYLANEDSVKEVHLMLADYFLGTWAGKKKPIKSPTSNGFVMYPCGNEADRLVALQPLSFETPGVPVRFNKRKYDQVPRHLYLAGRFKELNSLVLFNYEWLYNKIRALSLTHIMADFVLNPGEEATLVEEALRVAEPTIQYDINNLAPEISGHLLPYYKTHSNIRALVQQCDTAGLKHCALIPNFPYHQVPGSSLQYTLTAHVSGEFFRLTGDDRYLLTKVKDSPSVYVYDVATGEAKGSVFASNGDLYVTPNGKLFIIVDHVTEKAIKIHNADTGSYVGQLIVMNHIQLKLKEKYKMGAVSLTNDRMSVIVTTETSYLCIADLPGCQFLQIIGLDGKCDVCEITPSGRYVFCNSNEFILCYDMYSLEHVCTVSAGHRPSSLAFTKDGFRAFLGNPVEPKLLVMHVHRGAVEMAYKTPLDEEMPDDQIVSLKVSPKDDMVLVRGQNNVLVYNRFTEKICARFPRPSDVPKEFKLPRSHYIDLYYSNAEFSRDGNFVIATFFRNIYLWQISTGNRITTIQAPVGVITNLLVSSSRSQVITHVKGSLDTHVWNIDEAVNQVNMLDKLTGAIENIKLTRDSSVAYVRCQDSDELGVIDMHEGIMLDLLTHDAPVVDFAPTPNGEYILISTKPKKKNTAFKIWAMDERKVFKEFGSTTGYCISAHSNSSIVLVAQKETNFKAPHFITHFSFMSDGFRESVHPLSLKYVLERPFLSRDDGSVVVLTAQDYLEAEALYSTPTICCFSLHNDLKVAYYTPESFQEAANINTILSLRPAPGDANAVMVLYSTESVFVHTGATNGYQDHVQMGMLVLDIGSGAINTLCEPFMRPGTPLSSIVFSESSLCIDSQYNIFDITGGAYIGQLPNPGGPPRIIACRGNIVIGFKDSRVYAISVKTGRIIANCEVHASISNVALCPDQRTIIIGCKDGTVVSYVLIDPGTDDVDSVISTVGSRSLKAVPRSKRHMRFWDKVEQNCPTYSRPPSAVSMGPKERVLLKQVKPVPKLRPNSDTLLYMNERSKSCVIQ